MRSISHHITLLVSNNPRRGHTHRHTCTQTHIPMNHTVSILRNQAPAGLHTLDLKIYYIIAIDRRLYVTGFAKRGLDLMHEIINI